MTKRRKDSKLREVVKYRAFFFYVLGSGGWGGGIEGLIYFSQFFGKDIHNRGIKNLTETFLFV